LSFVFSLKNQKRPGGTPCEGDKKETLASIKETDDLVDEKGTSATAGQLEESGGE